MSSLAQIESATEALLGKMTFGLHSNFFKIVLRIQSLAKRKLSGEVTGEPHSSANKFGYVWIMSCTQTEDANKNCTTPEIERERAE